MDSYDYVSVVVVFKEQFDPVTFLYALKQLGFIAAPTSQKDNGNSIVGLYPQKEIGKLLALPVVEKVVSNTC